MSKMKTCIACSREYISSGLEGFSIGVVLVEGQALEGNYCSTKCMLTFLKNVLKTGTLTKDNELEVKLCIEVVEDFVKIEELHDEMESIMYKERPSKEDVLKLKYLNEEVVKLKKCVNS